MSSRHDDDDAGARGWRLAQLRSLADEARALAETLAGRLDAFDPAAIRPGEDVTLAAPELSRALDNALELQDVADTVAVLAGGVGQPRDALTIPTDALANASATAMRGGIGHRATLLLSASLLTPSVGLAALADAIVMDASLTTQWYELTVRDLLGAFRDVDPALVERVCRSATVDPSAGWTSLDIEAVTRLAGALHTAAHG
ncbi:MAG TPA: hypothetical protein VK506_04350 [Conexibacter sp.]|nr:hypothetical protein [Conexibacter sp.]